MFSTDSAVEEVVKKVSKLIVIKYLSRLTIIVFILTKFLAFKISPVKFMNVFTYLIPPGMPIYCRLKIQSKPKYVLTSLISTRFQNNDDDLCQERESGPWL